MYFSEFHNFPYWWIFPILMIAVCLFIMRGRKGYTICGFGSRSTDRQSIDDSDSARDILDKRYARGEIDRAEYEEKRRTLNQLT